MSKFPITSTAFEKLKEEIHYLKYTERPNISKSIAEAREFGDLSENAEYHAAREKQAFIESRINDFEDKLARAEVIHIGKIASDKVTFGATVKMKDDDTEEILNYMIVGEYEADISKHRISIVSPIARALIGKKVGDLAEVVTPKGEKGYEILEIKYIDLKDF
jgi:transcription elongation factor GreA